MAINLYIEGLPLLVVGLSAGLGIKYDMYVIKDDDDKVSL